METEARAMPVGRRRLGLVFRKRTIFTAVALALSIFFVQQSTTFPFGSGLYPMVIGSIAIGLSLAQLVLELRGGGGEMEAIDIAIDEEAKGKAAMRRALRFLVWFAGIYLGTALIGFNISIFLFFVLFMRIEGNIRWRTVILLTAIACGLELYYFPHILSMKWPEGLIHSVFPDFPL